MSTKYFALLTQLGADKLANAAALGTKIEITHMAVGDGGGSLPVPDTKQTKLINEKRRAAINTLSIDPKNTNQIIAEQVIPEAEGGWWIREIGLYDKDGVLVAVGNCAETYKPQLQEGSGRTQTIRMILIVSSANAVTLKVDPSIVLATREYVDNSITKHANSRNHPDATLKEKGFVILSSAVDSNSETYAATPKAVKAAYDLANAANNNANTRLEKNKNGADIPNKDEFVKNLGLTETRNLAQNAYPKTGGKIEGKVDVASDIEAAGWIGGKELWERKADGGWIRAYSPQNKPTAEEIQVEPRFNTTIDLTGLSSDRYYPVWWRFPHNYGGANAWLTLHRTYSEDWEKKPFGEGVTHLAGLQLQIEGSEVAWGGDAQYLNIKRIRQTYRNTVKSIHYRMMSIARPIDDKYPLYEGVKSGDIVQSPVFSGCYLRGGLTYHVTSNFDGIHYSREEGEVEAHQSIQPHNKFEIKWMVKSYAIDDPLLGKEYDDNVLPYGHEYAETILLAKNAYPKTGGKIEGKVDVTSDIEATGWIGGKELWERKPNGEWVRAYTPQNKPSAADIGALPITGGQVAGNVDATGWVGGKELWERKSDGGWVRAYTPQNKPSAAEIQVEPRFNNTIDLTGLSSDRYYPVWWRFPHNDSGANPWLTIHRNYAENRGDKNPFGKDVTHLAGLLLQMEGGDTRWGGDAQYLNIKRIRQTYRNTVKNIRYAMMSIARPIDDKYPLYEGVKSGDIVQSPVFSGCYLRGGLTYHVTSNFSDIHYSREDGEVEAHQSIQPYNNFEIKWMVKSYAIDDPQLGSEYDDTVLPYAHDYAETINLAKNAYPKTGGKIEGKVDVTSDIEATGWIGGKELWERRTDGSWVRAATLDDITANKSTAQKEPNGWWKCGDTGMIIQWGVVHGRSGTTNVSLPIPFPTTGAMAVGTVYKAIHYGDDDVSSSVMLVDNSTLRVTIDYNLPTAWIAIGY